MPDHSTHSFLPDGRPTADLSVQGNTADPAAVTGIAEIGSRASTLPTFSGRYRLLGEIARGGMGVVHRATDEAFGREVAVKVLQEQFTPTSGAATRFLEEARITGQLQHTAIPPVHDVGTLSDGRPFLVMKLIKGDTLEELLKGRAEAATDCGRFVAIFEQVCQAVAYAHERKVIHRDLKPANVMVGGFGEVQVMDWGLAKVLGNTHPTSGPTAETVAVTEIRGLRDSDGTATQAGSVLGTPAFMPPEQAMGSVAEVDERSDVFGLGAVLCMILTGKPPYVGADVEAVRLMAIRGQTADAFARLDACGADAELVAVCRKCLAAERETRPRDGGEVALAVTAHLSAAEERVRRAELDRVRAEVERSKAEAETREQRKRRRVQLALAISLLVLVAVTGVGVWWAQNQAAERDRLEADRREEKARQQERDKLGTEAALAQAADLRKRGLWQPAEGVIQQALDSLGADSDDVLRNRLELARSSVQFAARLEKIPFSHALADGVRNATPDSYVEAFQENGLDLQTTDSAELIRRIANHPLRDELVAALDDGAREYGGDKAFAAKLLEVAAGASRELLRQQMLAVWNNGPGLLRFSEGLDLDRVTPALLVTIALQLIDLKQDGTGLLERSCNRYPADFWLHYYTARGLHYLPPFNRWADAAAHYRMAIAIRPGATGVWAELASCLSSHDNDGAIATCLAAIRLDPKDVDVRNVLSWTLRAFKKDRDGAIAVLREGLRIDPNNTTLLFSLAATFEDMGDLAGTIAVYQQLIRIDPNKRVHYFFLAVALYDTADFDGAIAVCTKAIQLKPEKEKDFLILLQKAERAKGVFTRLREEPLERVARECPTEVLEIARLHWKPGRKEYLFATRMLAAVFAAKPSLADDLKMQDRYNAACAAVLAAAGQDKEATALGIEEWGYLTDLAHQWLRDDFAAYRAQARDYTTGAAVRSTMNHWKKDSDLTAIRDPAWLAAMPPTDRKRWEELWADVDDLLATAGQAPPPRLAAVRP